MKYSVEELLSEGNARWDRRIAADLASEIEGQLGEKVDTIPEMRRLLAVKGYRELRLRLELDTSGHHGDDAKSDGYRYARVCPRTAWPRSRNL